MTTAEAIGYLLYDIEKANQTLDWIEQRQGPLPPDGYARIETTVQVVRALRAAPDDCVCNDHPVP